MFGVSAYPTCPDVAEQFLSIAPGLVVVLLLHRGQFLATDVLNGSVRCFLPLDAANDPGLRRNPVDGFEQFAEPLRARMDETDTACVTFADLLAILDGNVGEGIGFFRHETDAGIAFHFYRASHRCRRGSASGDGGQGIRFEPKFPAGSF